MLFIMEFRNWTHDEAADAYMFNLDVQYALNLKPENQSLCRRTIERYIRLFRTDELAQILTILDFAYDSQSNRFTHCPAGLELHRAHYREYEDQHLLLMLGGTCCKCPLKGRCPISRDPMLCQLRLNGQDLRLAQRRAAERTDDFKTDYRMRGGIEAINSMLKRVTGLNRLRVRGRPAVFSSILPKVAGWNLLRAASARSLIAKLTKGGKAGDSASTSRAISELLHGLTLLRNGLPSFTVA